MGTCHWVMARLELARRLGGEEGVVHLGQVDVQEARGRLRGAAHGTPVVLAAVGPGQLPLHRLPCECCTMLLVGRKTSPAYDEYADMSSGLHTQGVWGIYGPATVADHTIGKQRHPARQYMSCARTSQCCVAWASRS